MITQISKDLEEKDVIVEKAKNNIKKLDGSITMVQNPFTYFSNIFLFIFFATARSTTT